MDDAAQCLIVRQNHPRTHTFWQIKHESLDTQKLPNDAVATQSDGFLHVRKAQE
jgi:hypothetical protein